VVASILGIPLPGQPLPSPHLPAVDRAHRLALDRFIAGPENCLAEVAVRSVLSEHCPAFNPVVFYGPTGTGKSHLARGLADVWKNEYRRSVIYTFASDFARDLTDAMETQAVEEFRARFRGPLLLVIEDVGQLVDQRWAQEELLHTLDAQLAAGNRVVITAPCAPAQLSGFLPGLRSRLSGGLTVPLVAPECLTRTEILRELAALRGLALSLEVVQILAEGLPGTVPELLGALVQLEMTSRVEARPIEARMVRRYLKGRTRVQSPQLREIARLTARHFSLKLSDLRSTSRRQAVVRARGVAIYLARHLTSDSLETIGRYFGGRDHTTVLHACRKTEELLPGEPVLYEAVLQVQGQLQ
jgi:chromosomal replication initiator protein